MAGSAGLPRATRLVGAENFRLAFAGRRAFKGQWLTVHLRARTDGTGAGARLGLVIGKRFCAKATRRNYLKRLIREHFRQVRATLGTVDLVVRLVRKLPTGLDGETRRSLHQDMTSLLARLNQVQGRST